MKGISRIDSERCRGWFVRVYRGKKVISKLFSDGKYGGNAKARALAIAFHKKTERSLPRHTPDAPPPFRISGSLLKANSTGINGVSVTYTKKNRKKVVSNYSVNYRLSGQVHNKRFSVAKFGTEKKALAEAVKFRKSMEKKMLQEWKLKVAKNKRKK